MKVLELFSGVGGWRFSWSYGGLAEDASWTAVDVNEAATRMYKFNWPGEAVYTKDIVTLPMDFFANFDIWFMSPPCQPFTKQGHQAGLSDGRCQPLLKLIQVIENLELSALPHLIMMENVEPFRASDAWQLLQHALVSRGYRIKEYVTTTLQTGIPNNRLRFYAIASLRHQPLDVTSNIDLKIHPVRSLLDSQQADGPLWLGGSKSLRHLKGADIVNPVITTEEFVTARTETTAMSLPVGGEMFTLATPRNYTACFTRAYGRYLIGTGSVIYDRGRCRLLSPIELARFMGYKTEGSEAALTSPPSCNAHKCLLSFSPSQCTCRPLRIPPELSANTVYRLLGNSINPQMAAALLLANLHLFLEGN